MGVSGIAGVGIGAAILIAGTVEQIAATKHAIVAIDVYNDRVLRAACATAVPSATKPEVSSAR